MSPAFNRSSALHRFKCGKTIEIHNRIMFDFYPRLSLSSWWPIFHAVHSLNRFTNANLFLASSNSIPTQKGGGIGGRRGRERMKEGIIFTFFWFTIRTQENGGRRGKRKAKTEGGREDGGETGEKRSWREVTVLTFLWFTIFMSRSSLNALFAYVSFWKGFTSFLIATLSPRSVSMAELEEDEKNFHFHRRYMHERSLTSLEIG